MAKTATSFKKGQGGKKPGTKHQSTKIKEAIGLDSWNSLKDFLLSKGTDKFQKEIIKLKGQQFTYAYLAALEYFKPKLQRTELIGDPEKPLQTQTIDVSKLSVEELEKLAAILAKGNPEGTGEAAAN